ncbi:Mitochondrial fission protein [Orbilia oligospora]|uniref:Mitochondrial fission protein n=1 Tax=Orbilia oligospora TaxID=2813651 RepID=A0A6G1MIS7_ORBOL|nr:Mitochondrial fission protein [Orbilia oligospora]KAF3194621.1 Mitochondrial fission protein [Orbilia oligospora]KAF3207379.1 Mitochondrial fission protein [Orbilia oligospora]KAF3230459.1 Mitochondrial fission protein [Orbilia oligospora]KAF3260423.1 Mitochondrial fission protein [Orbilia oligospora]
MASRSASRDPGRTTNKTSSTGEDDASILSNALTAVSNTNISSFSRKVTSTAGTLIGPFSDPGSHYHNAMSEVSKDLKRPSIQKRVFSFSKTSPSEIVRSKLSATEISHRALTYLPDDLLKDIPENDASYSLFQGFKASVDTAATKKHREGKNLLEESTAGGPNNVTRLSKERDRTNEELDLLGVRKSIASGEIREIDRKIAQLTAIRGVVLERLAKLEQEETQLEHDLLELDNKIEDIQYDMVEEGGSPIEAEEAEAGFMSESIYSKLPSPKGRKRQKRKAMPILHEHMSPGSEIKEMQCHADLITALDFDFPFGKLVTAALDDTVRVWDLNSGRSLGQLEGHHASVKCLQVEDNYVATGSTDATIRFWDLSRSDGPSLPGSNSVTHKRGPQSNQEEDFEDDMSAISSPTGPRSSAGTQDCHLLTLDSHIGEVTALYFQNGTLVSGSADKTLRQWDLSTGRCVQTLDILWTASSTAASEDSGWSFASLGRSSSRSNLPEANADFVGALQCFDAALACGTADGLVRLWDLRSGQVHRSLVGHTGPVTALQFDDTYLVTGSMDRSIRIWDLRTGSISDAFAYEHPITSMQFDAARIVSAAGENYAKIYDRVDGRHWNCGAGAEGGKEDRLSTPAIVERVRAKEGYLVEGRRDGVVGIWTC